MHSVSQGLQTVRKGERSWGAFLTTSTDDGRRCSGAEKKTLVQKQSDNSSTEKLPCHKCCLLIEVDWYLVTVCQLILLESTPTYCTSTQPEAWTNRGETVLPANGMEPSDYCSLRSKYMVCKDVKSTCFGLQLFTWDTHFHFQPPLFAWQRGTTLRWIVSSSELRWIHVNAIIYSINNAAGWSQRSISHTEWNSEIILLFHFFLITII